MSRKYSLNVTIPRNSSANIAIAGEKIDIKVTDEGIRNAFKGYQKGEVISYLNAAESRFLRRNENEQLRSLKIVSIKENTLIIWLITESGKLYSDTLIFNRLEDVSIEKVARLQYTSHESGALRRIMEKSTTEQAIEAFEKKKDGWKLLKEAIEMQEKLKEKETILEQQANN